MTFPSEKPQISGIKLSTELVQIILPPGAGVSAAGLFHDLAGLKVNMPLITVDAAGGELGGACCIAAEDLHRAAPVLEPLSAALRIRTGVGSLTVFPHEARFDLLVCLLAGFGRRDLPVYAVASSLATLTFTTDFERLDDASAAVLEHAALPGNHAPFRPEFTVRQI